MIRLATTEDLPAVSAIYEAIHELNARGLAYTNWQQGVYPSLDTARQALAANTLYVGEEAGQIWGTVILNSDQLPEYCLIPWTIAAEKEQVAVIHTLCVHPAQTRKGYARKLVRFCEDESRRQGKTVLRLDTWEHNTPANAMYPAFGYHFAGAAEFFFQGAIHEVLNCYEKTL